MVMPLLVALGSIPRKNNSMANTPEIELAISTGKTNYVDGPLYYITIEVTSASGIVPDIFVLGLTDPTKNSYAYTRVASLRDIQELGASPLTTLAEYRARNFMVETNSASSIKELKEGVPLVVQSLLDETSRVDTIESATTVKLRGSAE